MGGLGSEMMFRAALQGGMMPGVWTQSPVSMLQLNNSGWIVIIITAMTMTVAVIITMTITITSTMTSTIAISISITSTVLISITITVTMTITAIIAITVTLVRTSIAGSKDCCLHVPAAPAIANFAATGAGVDTTIQTK